MSWNFGDKGNLFLNLKSNLDFIKFLLQLQKTYTNCSWNATFAKHWKDCF